MTSAQVDPHWRTALAIFAFLAGVYLMTTGGHTSSKDEELLFGVTENVVVWHSFALNAAAVNEPPSYSYYGPGVPIASAPLYILGRTLASLFPADAYPWVTRAVTLWFNPLISAGTGALVYLAAAYLGYRRRAAIATAMIYAFATFAWPYAKTFFAEPATAFFLFASCVAALAEQRGNNPRTTHWLLLLSGLLAVLSLPMKLHGGLALPFLGLYAALGRIHRPFFQRATLYRFLAWGVGMAVALSLMGWYQASLYGSPFRSGYSGAWGDLNPASFWYRLSGLVWSSGRGMIWYAPPLMLLPVGLWLLWQRDRRVTLLCVAVTAAHLGFYANLLYWHGGGAWGPRYLVIALPFMVLPLSALLDTLHGRQTPWRVAVLVFVLLLAVPVQIGGVCIANEAFFGTKRNVHRNHFDPWDSAIVGHLALALDHAAQYGRVYLAPNSISLIRGFSYSEGNRDEGEQVPRWTTPPA